MLFRSIRKIAEETWRDTYSEILSNTQLEWMFEWMYSTDSLTSQINEGQLFFILHYNESPCGYISIQKESKDRYHFQKIYLQPSMQGKGLGKILINKGIEYVKDNTTGGCRIVLNVNRFNAKAVGFYKNSGFNIIDSGDFDIGHGYYMTDYIMAYDLD